MTVYSLFRNKHLAFNNFTQNLSSNCSLHIGHKTLDITYSPLYPQLPNLSLVVKLFLSANQQINACLGMALENHINLHQLKMAALNRIKS